MNSKIIKQRDLKAIVKRHKKAGKKIVFTNGCFDVIHAGHVDYLEKAKKYGDILIVALNTDSSVKKIKGKTRPIVSENDRAKVVAGLGCVDYVTFFNETTPFEIIKNLIPDILIKGADYKSHEIVGNDIVRNYGGKVIRIKLLKGRSTTEIIKKIKSAE
jgi:D-beta-D-heptose 7-phosphate kinase/D-beta-D-heptose 1-phosphate adenosyltransferase